jgi:hypothetical protein
MTDEAVPEAVQRFIALHIDSVAKIEALLLMYRNPEQTWDAALLAKRLYITPAETAKILAELHARQFLDARDLPKGSFCYRPASSELTDQVQQLADTYAKRLVAVTHLIHQRAAPSNSLQMFADAFKLKKDKET